MKGLLSYFVALLYFAPAAFAADATPSRSLPASVVGVDAAQSRLSASDDAAAATATDSTAVARVATRGAAISPTPQNQSPVNAAATNRAATGFSRSLNLNTSTATASATARDTSATISRSAGVSRAGVGQSGADATSARDTLNNTVNTVGTSSRTNSALLNNTSAVRRAGITLRPTFAEVGGRATIGGTDAQTGSNVSFADRNLASRAAVKNPTKETISEAKDRLEQTAELNKSCQAQYNECMDQFCAVIDANQKRCSCSSNLARYTKVENAVKDANAQLNEVAQRIRYVGLSADEIRAIMSATEAEEELSGKRDTTETRNMLAAIEDMIKDPVSATSYGTDTYYGLDMDLNFSADMEDIFSLDFLNVNNGSFSNLRGTELYNAAKRRCNTILTQCKEVGATAQQITGNYDLAIDKDCIAYEQGLAKMNETLVANVGSATRMLQKARLAVLQNKNQYDAKGCIAALDACMTDDMVCGADYEKCLDPTKRYIDENGEVVLGRDVTAIRDFMYDYNNASVDKTFLSKAYSIVINPDNCRVSADTQWNNLIGNDGSCNVKYLLSKIGTKQKATDEGLCRPVLDKCQRYTYDGKGNYQPYNDVVVNYIQRAMVNIKAAQEKIISDYASSCLADVAACYNQQVTQVNTWASAASVSSIHNVMRGACRNVALTCAYAVFDGDENDPDAGEICSEITSNQDTCIEKISTMFYQSLLCPDNSDYVDNAQSVDVNNKEAGFVNAHCQCRTGYVVWGSSCLIQCDPTAVRNMYGTCSCPDGQKMDSTGACVVQK